MLIILRQALARTLFLIMVPLSLLATPSSWTAAMTLDVIRIESVVVSPDHQQIAVLVKEADTKDSLGRWVSKIYIQSLMGDASYEPIYVDPANITSLDWTVEGNNILFLSSRSGSNQIWQIDPSGENLEQISFTTRSISSFKISPDGTQLAVIMSIPNETPKTRLIEGDKNQSVNAKGLYLLPIENSNNSSEVVQLSSGGVSVPSSELSFSWSSDSTKIVYSHQPTASPNDSMRRSISIVDVVTRQSSLVFSLDESSAKNPIFTLQDDAIVFVMSTPQSKRSRIGDWRIMELSLNDRSTRLLGDTYNHNPTILGWINGSSDLLISEAYHFYTKLYKLPRDGSEAESLSPQRNNVFKARLSKDGCMVGFVSEGHSTPPEAFVSTLPDFKSQAVSSVQNVPTDHIGATQVVEWESSDGTIIEGLLTLPYGYIPGTPIPLLVELHGGPTSRFPDRFIGRPRFYAEPYVEAIFSSAGYAVFRPNVRGSDGYGWTFRAKNYQDLGGMDFQDVLTGIDHLVNEGIADQNKVAVFGWSYGGYLTCWAITQTDFFRVAVAGAPPTNLISLAHTQDIPDYVPTYLGCGPIECPDMYLAHSPITYVNHANTPLLLLHGEEDPRVPVGQSQEFYDVMRSNGQEVDMCVYQRQKHMITSPTLLLDSLELLFDWIDSRIMSRAAS